MDLPYKQEVGVGAMVLLGLALFAVGMFWLTGRSIRSSGVSVNVQFANVSGLKQGDAVLVSGVKKGRVASVRLERPGRVTVRLDLAPDVRPRIDASATVAALDFVSGAKFVDYNPGVKEEFLPADRAIVGANPAQWPDIASGVATRANELLGNANTLVSPQLGEDLHNTLIATQRGLNVMAELGRGPAVKQAQQTLAATEKLMTRLDSMLASPTGQRLDTLSKNLASLTNHLGHATVVIDTLLSRINRGEGSLGRVAQDTALYNDLHNLSVALTALLKDLKENPDKYMKPGLVRVKLF